MDVSSSVTESRTNNDESIRSSKNDVSEGDKEIEAQSMDSVSNEMEANAGDVSSSLEKKPTIYAGSVVSQERAGTNFPPILRKGDLVRISQE